jgi:FkbM family methyltransferase
MVSRLSTGIKNLSIAVGLYPLARRLSRAVRPREHKGFQEDIELFRSLLPPRALSFDVGANVGDKSEALLRAGARVVAFEPNTLVVPELRARCGSQKNWSLVEAGLGSGPRIAILHAQEIHSQTSFSQSWDGGKIIASFPVPVVTLDAAIECFGLPDYCKIDVEGWEPEVLAGLTQLIPLISFEFHLGEEGVQKARSCLERLDKFGPSRLNITPAESSTFLFKDWIPLGEFLERFPENVIESLPGNPYGDMFVRSVAPVPNRTS